MFVKLILQVDTHVAGVELADPHARAMQLVKDTLGNCGAITILGGYTSCFNPYDEEEDKED